MNIKDAIALNNKHGKNRMPLDIAKQFWAEKQDKILKDDALIEKTFSGIKLIESLVRKDLAQKYIQPEKMSLSLQTCFGSKTAGKKVTPYTLWINLADETGKTVLSLTYKDANSGKSLVVDNSGNEVFSGDGWKKIRAFFQTEVEKPAEAAEEKKAEKMTTENAEPDPPPEQPVEKPKKLKKAAKKAPATKTTVDTVSTSVVPATTAIRDDVGEEINIPEIPEELQ